ncbi:MAG TPA: ABC transporter substrate-binding protein [Actinomycetota bacterium]|nr:ABC transporter substrate-binding protein [Actinomycetota bacterium]
MRAQDPASLLIARQLYEGLTRWDPVEERVLPGAAESWTVAEGGTEFTFTLQQGLSFHDDSPLTARDFKYAFERIALKANAAELAYVLEPIEGFPLVNELGISQHLSGIRVLDDRTLQIRTSEPYYELPAVLTHPGLVPLKKDAVEDFESFLTSPIGNGPFRIAQQWAPGDPVLLRSFLGWPDTPELDGIAFVPYPTAASSWIEWLEGNLHVAEVPAGQIETAREIATDRGFVPLLATYSYGVNIEAITDVRVRRAINHAIDRRTISATIFKGTLEPARGIVPAGMPGFIGNACVRLCRYAPRAAKAVVDRLPRSERKLTLSFSGAGVHRQVARALASDLEDAGFEVTLESLAFDRYVDALDAGEQQLYRLGWIAEYPTPGDFLSALFASDSEDNYSGFASERVDDLLSRARAEPSDSQRTSLYQEAERVILRAAPIVPLGTYVSNWAARPEVVGISFDQMGGFDAADLSLARA